MLLNRWLQFAEGTVRVRVEAVFPERVMNLMSSHGLRFWDVRWESEVEFTCSMSRRDFKRLRVLTERQPCRITVERRRGIPYLALRAGDRRALVLTLLLAAALLFFGSFCVWEFEVEGETAVSEETILRVLASHGVKLGVLSGKIDSEKLRNEVLTELPELSWIAVNVKGFKAYVQVRPRIRAPEVVKEGETVNIVARRDAVVEKVQPLWGEAVVLSGMTVKEGDLLISGVSHRGGQEVQLLSAVGNVEGRTWYTLTAEMSLTAAEKRYTGEEKTALSLVIGNHRIKILGNSRYQGAKYDKITRRTKWDLFGLLPLPVTTVREKLRFYETETVTVSAERQQEIAAVILEDQLAQCLAAGEGEVLAKLVTAEQRQGRLRVTLRAECREQIARAVTVPAEEGSHSET